jgi:aminoglycoside phosphotransferase (APT) family kinase protein
VSRYVPDVPGADVQELDALARRASTAASTQHPGSVVTGLESLSGGYSSLTYTAVLRGPDGLDVPIVIKVAPAGVAPIKNRDMLRQARVLRALADVPDVRVPEVLFESAGDPPEDPPFFASAFVDGDSVEPLVDVVDDPSGTVLAERSLAAARMLGALHRVDPASVGLGDEPETSLPAEVEYWIRSFESVEEDLRLGGVETGRCLLDGVPEALPAVLVHGDYKLGNLRAEGAEIRAIVDWEIWSVGDGRIDLAWFLLMLDADYPMRAREVPELPPPSRLHAEYEATLDRQVRDLDWFHAFVRYKQAAATALLTKQARKRGGTGYPQTISALLDAAAARIGG